INDHHVAADPGQAINRLVERIVEAQAAANRTLAAAIDEIAARFSDDLDIPLTGMTVQAPAATLAIQTPEYKKPSRGFLTFRQTWTGGGAGAAAGTTLGFLVALAFPPA